MREWLARLVDRFRRDRLDAELEEELRFHRSQLERDERALGSPDEEAKWSARKQLGNVTRVREQARDRWSLPWLDHVEQDVRYALRGLRRSPAFTASVVVTLGLGIGANAAIFSVVDRLLLRPPPLLVAPTRVNQVYASYPTPDPSGEQIVLDAVPYRSYLDLAHWTTSFERSAAFAPGRQAVGSGQNARDLPVPAVTAEFFGFFDAPPALGRYFTAQEDEPPVGVPVVVLTYGTWQSRYGGRADVLGKTLQIGPTLYTIIGVAPRGFVGLWPEQPPVAFIPFAAGIATSPEPWWTSTRNHTASMIVRRRPSVTEDAASSDLTAAMLRSWDAGGAPGPATRLRPRAIAASVLAERGPNQTSAAKVAALVGGMALVVLLIAAVNVANLLLARALRRRREIAVRLAIGVSRGRLLSQLLSESVLLALLGGLVGLIVAQWGGTALRSVLLPPEASTAIITDERTMVFVCVAVLVVGIVTGLAPAWQACRADLTRDLRSGVREGAHRRSRVRVALLILQAAMSVTLLVGAGLFVRSLSNVKQIRLGYDVDPIVSVDLIMADVPLDSARSTALRDRLVAAARQLPNVERVALSRGLPIVGGRLGGDMRVPGLDMKVFQRLPDILVNVVTPEYFPAMGLRVLRGRGIDRSDVAGAPGAVVVSNSLAHVLWPGKDAIGQCVQPRPDAACAYVVGVAADIKMQGLSGDPGLLYYRSVAQANPRSVSLVVRTRGPGSQQVEAVRKALQGEMPGGSYVTVTPFSSVIGEATKSWRLGTTMFVAFGGLALVLAAIGLYSVVSYDVAQRTHELGVRRALGAQAVDVLGLVLRHGVALGVTGVVLGAAVTFAVAGQVGPLLFGVSPHDPAVYALVACTMLLVAVVASVVPARRAARIDPIVALRSD
ncbi:MAG TPA: ADOP family duplicated permease [Gemmatimonadaceae bacterium]|nr:ADOP family duplicated permease [Gemmatimonadaceae bacterium]